MKSMTKHIAAAFAALMMLLASFGLAGTANADDTYIPQAQVNGDTISVTGLPGDTDFWVGADDTYVSGIQQVAEKYYGAFHADANGNANLKLDLTKLAKDCGGDIKLTFVRDNNGHADPTQALGATTVSLPKTGDGANCPTTNAADTSSAAATTTTSGKSMPNTGAAVAPYAIVVAMLAVAGGILLAIRKTSARR